jgi:hypothetical protein
MLVRAEFYPGETSTHPRSSPSPSHRNQRFSIYAPKAALLNQSGTTAQAWVIEDHRAQRRDLKLGTEERGNHLHVLDGLRPGDQLILPPHDKLKEGSRVRAKN